jgi:hypothetical protein
MNKIRDEKNSTNDNMTEVSVLHNHRIAFDDVRRKIYIRAEIHKDCLDRGSDITQNSGYYVERHGVVPGDVPVQLIAKRLGGPGHHFNVVPLNATVSFELFFENFGDCPEKTL